MKRLAEFVRSVIPADPFQILFLSGIVCLIASHGLRWWPKGVEAAPARLASSIVEQMHLLPVVSIYLIIFAGMAGYFISFWPGDHAVRRIFWFVLLPTISGIILQFSRIIYLVGPSASTLESTSVILARKTNWAISIVGKLATGFRVSLLGLLLIAIFTSRLAFGIATLPLSLSGVPAAQSKDARSWQRLHALIFFLIGPVFLPSVLLGFVIVGIPVILRGQLPSYVQSGWFSRVSSVVEIALILGIVMAIVGREGRQKTLNVLRMPRLKYSLVAILFPVAIGVFISTIQYVFERAEWAAQNFGRYEPPQFWAYFQLPDPWLLLLIISAIFEEIIFRGLIQPQFIQKYGQYRGIFLVGIIWAAFHFFSDFSFSRSVVQGVLLTLIFRILMCISLSFVLGWLTLRSGSVLPAGIAHGLYNVLVYSGLGPPFSGKDTIRVALWAVLACVLFRFWPIQKEYEPKAMAASELTPAV